MREPRHLFWRWWQWRYPCPERIDLVVINLREDDLLGHTHREIAAPVEALRTDAAEVTDTRYRDANQALEKLVHAFTTQRYLASNRPALANLESGDGFARLCGHRLLARDGGKIIDGVVEDFLVADSFTHAHVQRDLCDLGHLHDAAVPELLHELGHDFGLVVLFESCHLPYPSIASPLERNTRTFLPSARTL